MSETSHTLNAWLDGAGIVRHDWTLAEAKALAALPMADLLFLAQTVHRRGFNPNEVQKSTLLSIKTGGCAENCGYCNQSAHFKTGLAASKLMEINKVMEGAARAKEQGASRFCMGAAWREPKDRDMADLCTMVRDVKAMGLETCMTLGMLSDSQTEQLAEAGLDYYNHNIDTSERYYPEVISTRTFDDRLDTLDRVRNAGINVCCGGIVGMGENDQDRLDMLVTLTNMEQHPGSVPINNLVPVPGTPLAEAQGIDHLDFVRVIAIARIMLPKSVVRLSAGREDMSDETQALCFLAGANSIFVGDELLTTPNPNRSHDEALFDKLGLRPMMPMKDAAE